MLPPASLIKMELPKRGFHSRGLAMHDTTQPLLPSHVLERSTFGLLTAMSLGLIIASSDF